MGFLIKTIEIILNLSNEDKAYSYTLLTFSVKSLFCQSIVNTEKLFTTNDEGLGISAELAGSSISGNASVLLLEYSLNFSYKYEKHYLRLLSGGDIFTKIMMRFLIVYLLNLDIIIL